MPTMDDLIEICQMMAVVVLGVAVYITLFGLAVWGVCWLAGWT